MPSVINLWATLLSDICGTNVWRKGLKCALCRHSSRLWLPNLFWHARLQKSSQDDSSTKYRSTVHHHQPPFAFFSLVSPYFVTLVITATHTQCLSAPPGRLDSLRPTGAKGNHNHDQKWFSSFFHVFNRLIINNVNKIAAELFKNPNICLL